MKRRKTAERGYGAAHKRERARWEEAVNAGRQPCVRCGRLIPPGGHGPCPRCGKNHAGWDMGHNDFDRRVWTGPEHVCCNRAAPRRKQGPQGPRPPRRVSRPW